MTRRKPELVRHNGENMERAHKNTNWISMDIHDDDDDDDDDDEDDDNSNSLYSIKG